jgi:hypothetical protein
MIKISLSNFGLLINGENKLQILLIFIKIPEHDVSVGNTKKYLFFFFFLVLVLERGYYI